MTKSHSATSGQINYSKAFEFSRMGTDSGSGTTSGQMNCLAAFEFFGTGPNSSGFALRLGN
jgi:hypothetical protein